MEFKLYSFLQNASYLDKHKAANYNFTAGIGYAATVKSKSEKYELQFGEISAFIDNMSYSESISGTWNDLFSYISKFGNISDINTLFVGFFNRSLITDSMFNKIWVGPQINSINLNLVFTSHDDISAKNMYNSIRMLQLMAAPATTGETLKSILDASIGNAIHNFTKLPDTIVKDTITGENTVAPDHYTLNFSQLLMYNLGNTLLNLLDLFVDYFGSGIPLSPPGILGKHIYNSSILEPKKLIQISQRYDLDNDTHDNNVNINENVFSSTLLYIRIGSFVVLYNMLVTDVSVTWDMNKMIRVDGVSYPLIAKVSLSAKSEFVWSSDIYKNLLLYRGTDTRNTRARFAKNRVLAFSGNKEDKQNILVTLLTRYLNISSPEIRDKFNKKINKSS